MVPNAPKELIYHQKTGDDLRDWLIGHFQSAWFGCNLEALAQGMAEGSVADWAGLICLAVRFQLVSMVQQARLQLTIHRGHLEPHFIAQVRRPI